MEKINKITSKFCINRRDVLSKEITKYWNIIKRENVISKKMTRNYDLHAIYNEITKMAEERINIKLYLQCINMGFKNFKEFNENSNYKLIFTLSEKQEQLFHLNKVQTINAKLKRKLGKKNMKETEELTSAFIKKECTRLQLEINKLNKDIEEFNNTAELEIAV